MAAVLAACEGPDGPAGAPGAPGPDGRPGASSAARVLEEPPGTHCALGGWRVDSGLDTDGDGVLSDAEVDATAYVCRATDGYPTGAILEGTYVIESSLDVARLAAVDEITGDLRIAGTGLREVVLERLRRVGGAVEVVAATGVETLELSALTEVGDLVIAEANALTAVRLPRLVTAGRITVHLGAAALDLSALRTADSVELTAALPDLSAFASLRTVTGQLAIDGRGATASLVGLERLESCGGLALRRLALDGSTALPALARVNGSVVIADSRGGSLSLPALVDATAIELVGNDLAGVSLGSLASTGALTVRDNPGLGFVRAPRLTGSPTLVVSAFRDARLVELDLSALRVAGSLAIVETGLAAVSGLPALEEVTAGDLTIARHFETLTTVSLPALRSVEGSLMIEENNALVALALPVIERVGPMFWVANSRLLCASQVQRVIDRLHGHGWSGQVLLANLDESC